MNKKLSPEQVVKLATFYLTEESRNMPLTGKGRMFRNNEEYDKWLRERRARLRAKNQEGSTEDASQKHD